MYKYRVEAVTVVPVFRISIRDEVVAELERTRVSGRWRVQRYQSVPSGPVQ